VTLGKVDRPVQILLVEDNPADAELTERALNNSGYHHNLTVAADGEEAMSFLYGHGIYATASRPDLILLDLKLPKKDGLEVLEEIKTDPDLKVIPVIILTSSGAQNDLLKSYGLAANSYIRKPMNPRVFYKMISGVLDYWIKLSEIPSEQ
jgi:CheY-like chemotaxis protein